MEEEMKREILKKVYPWFRRLMDEFDERARRWKEEKDMMDK
jgi:hypothetical protein